MGLKITSSLRFSDGGTSTNSYLHISDYNKPKEVDSLYVKVNLYTSKAKRDENINYKAQTVGGDMEVASGQTFELACTMAEYTADDGATISYTKLKTYLAAAGHTVVDEI